MSSVPEGCREAGAVHATLHVQASRAPAREVHCSKKRELRLRARSTTDTYSNGSELKRQIDLSHFARISLAFISFQL
jgi:hypothetical protein